MERTDAPKSRWRTAATEFFPVSIPLFSLLLSAFNFYIGYLKAPDIGCVIAPYVSQVVDLQSRDEAFFIPRTIINQGALP